MLFFIASWLNQALRRILIDHSKGGRKGDANLFYASYNYEDLVNRDKASLDIFWLRDESLEESDIRPDPDILAQQIVEDLEAALEQFQDIAVDLGGEAAESKKE